MTTTLPIVVNMTVDSSKTVFAMALESNLEEVTLQNDTVINVTIYDVPHYEGSYTITPLANQQVVLETEGKMMDENLTVLRIPTYETRNDYGMTMYIAEV